MNSNKKAEKENEMVLVQLNFYNPIGQGPGLFCESTLRLGVQWAARNSEYKVSDCQVQCVRWSDNILWCSRLFPSLNDTTSTQVGTLVPINLLFFALKNWLNLTA